MLYSPDLCGAEPLFVFDDLQIQITASEKRGTNIFLSFADLLQAQHIPHEHARLVEIRDDNPDMIDSIECHFVRFLKLVLHLTIF